VRNEGGGRSAALITISDGVAAGVRDDVSGERLASRLAELGFAVDRAVVPDEKEAIGRTIADMSTSAVLVVTTGGTGLTPRDVTPQATQAIIDYEVPGLAEAMRADGRRTTPLAALSRAVVGVRGRTLIVNVPGSPNGALESLEAIVPVLDHALETLAGPVEHSAPVSSRRR
jgi:molybdenum cofactor synthesis domain-containing protein